MTDKRRLNAEAARWLKENAPADLRDDRLDAEPTLHYSGALEDGRNIEPSLFAEPKIVIGESLPPVETFSRSEYLKREQQRMAAAAEAAKAEPKAPIRGWTGGQLPGVPGVELDYDLDNVEERDAGIGEVVSENSDQFVRVWEDADDYEDRAYAAGMDSMIELDDRPQWMRDLGMVDEDIPVEDVVVETEQPDEALPVPMCVHCHAKPIKYKGTGWCFACHEWARKHPGELRPLRLTKAKRANI